MTRIYRALALLFCAALCLATGCGAGRDRGGNGAAGPLSLAAPPALTGLASPLEMLKQASTGPLDGERFRNGDAHDLLLPHNKVNPGPPSKSPSKSPSAGPPGSDTLGFEPTWSPPGSASLNDAAYAVYRVANMTDYTGLYRVLLNWVSAPADYNNLYIGISDFSQNAWVWQRPGSDNSAAYPDFTDLVSPTGDMLIVVLLLGTDSAELDWVLAGGALQVLAYLDSDLNSDPTLNFAPLTINFDATGSSVTGASIVGYDWDFDSDGTYEIEGDTTGLASHTYSDPGDYTCTVHVVTDEGTAGTESLAFHAVNPANTPPNAVLNLDVSSGTAPLTVNLSSASTDDGQIVKHEWDINNDGTYDYDTGSTPNLQHLFAMLGGQQVTLRVTDDDFATDTDTKTVTLSNGWSSTTIANNVAVSDEMAMAVSGPLLNWKACVAYQDYTNDDLFFARATNADGSTWGAPVEPVDNSVEAGYGPAMIAATGSGPLLAYGVRDGMSGDYSLHITRATDTTGASWNPPVTVDSARSIGSKSAIAFVSGKPALWSIEDGEIQGGNKPQFYLATAADGSTWGAPVKIADPLPLVQLSGISAGVANGQPYLACASYSQAASPFSVYSASANDGSAWNAALNIGSQWIYNASTAIVGGRPALGGGGGGTGAGAYYLRANTTSADDWPAEPVQIAQPGDGGEASLALIGSGPALAWINLERSCVMYCQALDASGDTWGPPYEVTPRESAYGVLRMVMVLGQPVICYSHSTNKTVSAAWLTP